MNAETVLCVESRILDGITANRGFLPTAMIEPKDILKSDFALFAPRGRIEDRDDFRQIIPYIILCHKGSVATYTRTTRGAEQRLYHLSSIGFGGHVELKDLVLDKDGLLNVEATIEKASIREIGEEVEYAAVASKELVGLIIDDRDLVNRVHLGIVEIWHLETASVQPLEDTITGCKFIPVHKISMDEDKLERWSYLCLAFLQGKVARTLKKKLNEP